MVHFQWLEFLSYFLVMLFRIIHLSTYRLTGSALPYLYYSKVIVTLVDYWLPLDMRNRTPEEQKAMEKDWRYTIPLYTYFFA